MLMSADDISSFAGSTEELDKMIEWQAGSHAVLRHYKLDSITRGGYHSEAIYDRVAGRFR